MVLHWNKTNGKGGESGKKTIVNWQICASHKSLPVLLASAILISLDPVNMPPRVYLTKKPSRLPSFPVISLGLQGSVD